MWTLVSVKKSDDSRHKLVALFRDGNKTKKTYFGAVGYSDYTIHKDKDRRERYRIRHKKDLRTGDPTRAGYLSYYLLWGDSTSVSTNLKQYKKRFFC